MERQQRGSVGTLILYEGFNPQGMNSLNHYAYGTVSRWFYEGILGITPIEPGFKKISIEPQFGEQLSSAEGGYLTPQGEVFVNWTIEDGRLNLDVTVPKNTVADIVLPTVSSESLTLNGVRQSAEILMDLDPGQYQISARLN